MEKFIIKQNKELRNKNYPRIIYKQIQTYICNGCKGSLNLIGKPISKLPNNLKYIGGFLCINETNITKLVNGLVIEGDLFCCSINISELPSDIEIKGDLWCWKTPLTMKYSKEEIKSKFNIHGKVYY